MICAGASEQGVSQWSSMFAEDGLKVSKTVGDLLGPCSFAFFMGLSRFLYGMKGENLKLIPSLKATSLLCILATWSLPFRPSPFCPWRVALSALLRGTDVARYLLPGSRLSKRRRHLYVRHVRPGRRHRLFCRSGRGRDHLPVYRKNESWDPYCHSLPVRNADTGIPLETSEAGIKAGYLIRNNLELKRTAVQRPRPVYGGSSSIKNIFH